MNSGSFFVTAGRGTESFVAQELREKLICENIKVRDGKVFFKLFWEENGNSLHRMLQLKSVERVFAAITNYDNVVSGKRPFLNRLMAELSNKENFQHPNRVCTQFFSSDLSIMERNWMNQEQGDTTDISLPTAIDSNLPATIDRNLPTPLEDKTVPKGYITKLALDHETMATLQNSPEGGKKRKLDSAWDDMDRAKELDDKSYDSELLSETSRTWGADVDTNEEQEFSQRRNIQHAKEMEFDDSYVQGNLSKTKNVSHEGNGSEKTWRQHPEVETRTVTFRMSVKCSGKMSKWINTKKLSRDVARRVARALGWSIDLKNPMFEVCLHINDHHVTAGIPVTKFPLSKRSYVHDSGLRAPVAWIMYQLVSVQAGEIVFDPLCGKATILIEACSEQPDAIYIGSDQNTDQLRKAADNLRVSGFENRVMLYQADALNMPFSNEAVDIVMCDAPFNQTHSTSVSPEMFYYRLLREIYRVLKRPGRFVLLTSQSLKSTVLDFMDNSDTESLSTQCTSSKESSETNQQCISTPTIPFLVAGVHYMKLGETHAYIIVMNKE